MLETKLCEMRLRNPTILASGILGASGPILKRVAKSGAGAVVTKSIGIKPREGYKNPTVVELGESLLNAIGLANPGYKEFSEEIKIAKEGNVPVISSIFGFTLEEFVEVAKGMQNSGADALELNLSCPHVEKAGAYYGQDPDLAYEVVRAVKKNVNIPVIPKLTASVKDIVEIAKACEDAKCDAITAINTIKGMKIDIITGKPILGNKIGGLSGPYIKPIAVRCVFEIAKEIKIPVIGCGGIKSGEDAIEFMMAGARAIEIGTGVYLRGISIFQQISSEIQDFMEKNNYQSLEEIYGIAL